MVDGAFVLATDQPDDLMVEVFSPEISCQSEDEVPPLGRGDQVTGQVNGRKRKS